MYCFKELAANRNISFVLHADCEQCLVWGDRMQIQKVVNNLLSNAFKYTVQGSITMGYEIRENGICFYVSDTGTGIPEDKVSQVFERFTKLDAKRQGTGLGLSISRTIIKKMGGEIGVTSKYGEGSTFWFVLPESLLIFCHYSRKRKNNL